MSALDEVLRDENWHIAPLAARAELDELRGKLEEVDAVLSEMQKAISAYLMAGMHRHGDIALAVVQRTCPRCIARENLSAQLEKWKETS